MKLSIILPAYNEEERLPLTIFRLKEKLDALDINSEIIVVSDGSIDGTPTLGEILKVKILHYSKNHGIAYAFRYGAHAAKGSIVMLCPSDVQNFDFIKYASSLFDKYDVISVSKRHPDTVVYGYDLWRWTLSSFYHIIIYILFNIDLYDDTHYVKFYKRKILEKILPLCRLNGAVGETELFVYCLRFGAKKIEIPAKIYHLGEHSKTNIKLIIHAFFDLFRLKIFLVLFDRKMKK